MKILVCVALMLLCVGCLRDRAVDGPLMSSIQLADDGVFEVLGERSPEVQAFIDDIDDGRPVDVIVWPDLRAQVERAIDAKVASGEWSEGVAASARERLRLFEEALYEL